MTFCNNIKKNRFFFKFVIYLYKLITYMTNLFLFDVDGTLAESTQKIPKSLINILKKI